MSFEDKLKTLEKKYAKGKLSENGFNSKIDEIKQELTASRDAVKYKQLCDYFGMEPELPDLYELGEAIELDQKQEESRLEQMIEQGNPCQNSQNNNSQNNKKKTNEIPANQKLTDHDKYIIGFIRDAKKYNIENINSHPIAKKNLMQETFPFRFGKGGIQDISNYSDAQIGSLFRGVCTNYSRKYINHV